MADEMGVDLIFGDPDDPHPDWRKGDPDDAIDDDDDPSPIAPEVLLDMLGFDPDELIDDESDDDESEDELDDEPDIDEAE
jgi:hypothetical protein